MTRPAGRAGLRTGVRRPTPPYLAKPTAYRYPMTRPAQTLSYRALNRAMLDRQLLLTRASQPAKDAITHLVGMQAQAPNASYVGLWSRLAGFDHAELSELTRSRQVVRIPVMRGTIHLVTAEDALTLRPLTQVVLTRAFNSQAFARNLKGLDLGPVLRAANEFAAEKPLTRPEVVKLLAERWPGYDAASLGYAFTYLLPLVQVPPRGIWGQTGPVAWTPVQTWLGAELSQPHPLDQLILRYLAAFGPATVADIQTWSGLTRLREVADRHAADQAIHQPDRRKPGRDNRRSPRSAHLRGQSSHQPRQDLRDPNHRPWHWHYLAASVDDGSKPRNLCGWSEADDEAKAGDDAEAGSNCQPDRSDAGGTAHRDLRPRRGDHRSDGAAHL